MLEEARFFKTIEDGIALFNAELKNTDRVFSGATAFKLYDTFGFPLDLTEDMLREKGLELDTETFDRLMNEQRQRAKAAWKGSGDAQVEGDFKALLERFGENRFVGYDRLEHETKVLALLSDSFEREESLHARHEGWVLLEETPFYAESGGQTGDHGQLEGVAEVLDTKKFFGLNLSRIRAIKTLKAGQSVHAVVDESRAEIARHHSATHLLHAALYELLGEHISQAGSLVEEDRLRFDFSHPKAMTSEEIAAVEERVNFIVQRGIANDTEEMSIDEAKKSGAKAQFGEKYGDRVRVVRFGDASIEFCGGTHVHNTSEIGMFIITKESGVSAGVRRIEAVCSKAAYDYFKQQRHLLGQAESAVKNRDILAGIERIKEQIATLKTELQDAHNAAKESLDAETINGVAVFVEEIKSGDVKSRIDELKNSNDRVAAMLFQVKGDKVMIAAGVKDAPIKAGDWIKQIAPILGGGGGGRPDFAQAGGKDPSKLPDAVTAAKAYVEKELGA